MNKIQLNLLIFEKKLQKLSILHYNESKRGTKLKKKFISMIIIKKKKQVTIGDHA